MRVDQQWGYLVKLCHRVERRQRRDVVGMQRTGDPAAEQRQRAVESWNCLRIEDRVHFRGAQHLEEVAEEPEPGHVGAGAGPIL